MSTMLSIKDTAALLDVSEQRVRTLCRQGVIDAEKISNSWIVNHSNAINYKLQNERKIAEDHPAYNVKTGPQRKPIALSFFSGAMGLDLGIEEAGFDIRLACELDKYCRKTIELNRPNTALLSDINNYKPQDILDKAQLNVFDDIDLVIGGPPCQAFSTAGKRKAFNDDRGNVFLKYIDLAIALNPKYIVIENVRGLLSCPMDHRPHNQRGEGFPTLDEDELKGGALNFVLSKLKKSGYAYSFNLYNAANFGTPQNRERVIIICSRDGKAPPFLTPTHSENGEFGLPRWRSIRPYLENIEKHDHLNFPEKRLKFYRLLQSGQNWRSLPIDLQQEAMGKSYYSGGGKTGFLRRLAWDRPSPTLVTHPAMPATDLAHPEEDRPLSIQEYKRLQDFPDNWIIAGPLLQQYKQVGNAVAVSFGLAVGKLILNLIKDKSIKSYQGFTFSRYKNTSTKEWEEDFQKRLIALRKSNNYQSDMLSVENLSCTL
jgi:DNA (cytosine-5)-methyltransferase 1